ncbi:MAG: hypothetical protein WC575_00030 [Patescibacteria group bacterium]
MNSELKHRSHNQLGDSLKKLISYCPLCEKSYNPLKARILDEKDGAHLVHLQCGECGSSIVALILTSTLGITSVGLVTDLTSEDVMKFKDYNQINSNEVINFHQLLYSS